MKILWMSPHLDSEHPLAQALASRGVALLVCGKPDEADSLIQVHGRTVDLAIVHREGLRDAQGDPEAGLKWLARIKSDPAQADLPVLLTADSWGEADFARHQTGPLGCNAYLRWPASDKELLDVIASIFPGEGFASQSENTLAPTASKISAEPPTAFKTLPGPSLSLTPSTEPPTAALGPEHTSVGPQVDSLKLPSLSLTSGGSVEPALAPPPSQFPEHAPLEIMPALSLQTPATPPEVPTDSLPFQLEAPETDGTGLPEPTPTFSPPEVPGANPIRPNTDFVGTSLDLGALVAEAKASMPQEPEPELTPIPAENVPETAPSEPVLDMSKIAMVEASSGHPADDLASDPEIAAEMPYLFNGTVSKTGGLESPALGALGFAQPLGDAVVPGGAAHSPDLETLKKYLLLREQDVAVLSGQLKSSKEQVSVLDQSLRVERAKSAELSAMIEEQKRRIDGFDREKSQVEESASREVNDYKFQLKVKADKVRALESHVRETTAEIERLKERVRADIRKIRVREKELENRLEILKKDSEALIVARENKIVDLKRRIDTLEFNMDLLQDQFSREKETNSRLRERLARASQVVRVAGGLLDAQAASALAQAVDEPAEESSDEAEDSSKDKAS